MHMEIVSTILLAIMGLFYSLAAHSAEDYFDNSGRVDILA